MDGELEEINVYVKEFMHKNSLLIDQCWQLLARVNQHNEELNKAKAVSIMTSALGGVVILGGVVLAPFTGGLSTALVVSGWGITGIGGIASMGTEVHDFVESKNFYERLRELAVERNDCAVRLSNKLERFDAFLRQKLALNRPKRVPTDHRDGNAIARQSIHEGFKIGVNAKDSIGVCKEFQHFKTARKGLSQSNGAMRTGVAATGKWVLKAGGMAAITLVLTASDASKLAKEWDKDHITVEAIKDLMSDLEADHKTIQSVQTSIMEKIKSIKDSQNNTDMD